MWVKVCGITRPEDAQVAAAAGADAVGFVFWPGSPRYASVDAARTVADGIPSLARVGVFVNQTLPEIADIAERGGLTHLQLHGDEDAAEFDALPLPVVRAFRHVPDATVWAAWQGSFAVLADGAVAGAYGGTGVAADSGLVDAMRTHPRMILAGGLGPDNVADRIRTVRPWGVDASSSLEERPGIKSHQSVNAFVAAARAALAKN